MIATAELKQNHMSWARRLDSIMDELTEHAADLVAAGYPKDSAAVGRYLMVARYVADAAKVMRQ